MAIGTQLSKVIKKIGVLFTRDSDSEEEYIDIDPTKTGGNKMSWINHFVRKCTIKYDTLFDNGDIVTNSIDNKKYIISNLDSDYLLGETMFQTAYLLYCNKSGELLRASGQRDSETYDYSETFTSIENGIYGCFVNNRFDILDSKIIVEDIQNSYFYTPASHDFQIMDRFVVDSGNFLVETIDNVSFDNLYVIKLSTDNR